jgi:hypothetical protein
MDFRVASVVNWVMYVLWDTGEAISSRFTTRSTWTLARSTSCWLYTCLPLRAFLRIIQYCCCSATSNSRRNLYFFLYSGGRPHSRWANIQALILVDVDKRCSVCIAGEAVCRQRFIASLAREGAVEINKNWRSCFEHVDGIAIGCKGFDLEGIGLDVLSWVTDILEYDFNRIWY